MSRFADKVVIVTGSSAGIGKAAILGFAKEGASVVLHGTNAVRLAEAEKTLHAAGVPESRILKVQSGLDEEASQDKLINETIARFGKIDVLVNNAGVGRKPGTDASLMEHYDYVFAVNVRAVFRLVELATPYLEKTKGNIINVSSIAAIRKPLEGTVESIIYYMSKAALDRFTKNINQSLMKKGIRINNINPGPFETNILNRSLGENASADAVAAATAGMKLFAFPTAAKRFGDPEELVPAFLLLADEKSSFITGSIWVIDGGMSTWAPEATDLKL
uniref:Short-chain dehydrogenase n=1 Tax=Panagrellus redivivus TaxID=6233 RepID=A0A7E5A011_PANRE